MGKVIVSKEPKQFSVSTICRLMDDCLPDNIKDGHAIDEFDMQDLISKIWPALVAEHQIDSVSIVDFLKENAPVYDDCSSIDKKYCCEKTLLNERERLMKAAQEVLK